MATKTGEVDSQPKETRTRVFRTKEERAAEIDQKIAYHQGIIDRLTTQKAAIFNPIKRTRKPGYNKALASIKEAGITPEELMAFVAKKKNG